MASYVYKYLLPLIDHPIIMMPAGAQPLCAQVQHGSLQLWARVPAEAVMDVPTAFRVAGTGHYLGENVGEYIDTVQLADGGLVFHVFRVHP